MGRMQPAVPDYAKGNARLCSRWEPAPSRYGPIGRSGRSPMPGRPLARVNKTA